MVKRSVSSQKKRAGDQERAYIHRQAQTGKEAQGRTSLDAGQDLEAYSQESWCREARRALKTPEHHFFASAIVYLVCFYALLNFVKLGM